MNRPRAWQWDDVQFFLAVARTGSLSAAARALRVGHVTVGRRIAALEKRLGVTLLKRTPDGFVTTSAGEAILRQCMTMENAALDLERIAAGRDSLVTGSVRVTTTETLAYQLIAPAIAALRQAHPELQVDLCSAYVRSTSRVATLISPSDSRVRPLQSSSAASLERSASRSTRRSPIWRE